MNKVENHKRWLNSGIRVTTLPLSLFFNEKSYSIKFRNRCSKVTAHDSGSISHGSNSKNSKRVNAKSRCKFNRATTATYRIRREWQIIEFLILNSRKRSSNGEFFDWNPHSSNASPMKPPNPVSLTTIFRKLS